MKTIQNKKTSIELPTGKMTIENGIAKPITEKDIDYAELIKICLDSPPQGGFTFEDFKQRSRIDNAITQMKDDVIELEDDDCKNLKKCVSLVKWHIRHNDLFEFLQTIEQL